MPEKLNSKIKFVVDHTGLPVSMGPKRNAQYIADFFISDDNDSAGGQTFSAGLGGTAGGTLPGNPEKSIPEVFLRSIGQPRVRDEASLTAEEENSQLESIANMEELYEGMSSQERRFVQGSLEELVKQKYEDILYPSVLSEINSWKDGISVYNSHLMNIESDLKKIHVRPTFPSLNPGGITTGPSPEECGDIYKNYYDSSSTFKSALSVKEGKGFEKLNVGYNPQAEWVVGITQPGTLGHTCGFTLDGRGGQTQWWFEGGDGNTGNTAGITAEICQILDLTAVSGTTERAGIGTLQGGVYVLFLRNAGPSGGTYGRGLTMFRPGNTGPEYFHSVVNEVEGPGVTAAIVYTQNLYPAPRCNTILDRVKLNASMRMLEMPVELTGGTGDASDPEAYKFKVRIKPKNVNNLINTVLDMKSKDGIIQTMTNFKEMYGSIGFENQASGSGITNGKNSTYTTISLKPSTSGSSGADKANLSAADELLYELYTIQGKIQVKYDAITLGATGASLDTAYKVKTYLNEIERRLIRSTPQEPGGTQEAWGTPPGWG
jgi:hypothetical protein